VWALDRNTFQKCLSAAAYKRRKINEELLAKVKLLEELDDYKAGRCRLTRLNSCLVCIVVSCSIL